MPDVMISYSRRDKAFVQKLHQRLAEQGRDVWVDWEDIPKTADWWKEIQQGIDTSDSFVFVISPDSVSSEVCGWEVQHAVELKKRLIPMLLREVTDPTHKAQMHNAINAHNWIFSREQDDFEKAFAELQNAIDTDLEHSKAHTRLLIRAKEWDSANRDVSLLLQGSDLANAEKWLAGAAEKNPAPASLHEQYIGESRRVVNARTRRARLMAGFVVTVVTFLVLAVSLAIYAMQQRAEAEAASKQAQALSILSVAQLSQNNGYADLGLALALEANRGEYRVEGEQVLAEIAYSPGTRNITQAINGWWLYIDVLPDQPQALLAGCTHGEPGNLCATRLIQRIDLTTGEILQEYAEAATMPYASLLRISPDGQQFVTTDFRNNIHVWNLTGGIAQTIPINYDSDVTLLEYLPNGSIIASQDNLHFDIWNPQTGELTNSVDLPFGDRMAYAALSPEGQRLVLYNRETGTLRLWDIGRNRELWRIDHRELSGAPVFSTDGRTLFAPGFGVEIVNAVTGQSLRRYEGHGTQVVRVIPHPHLNTVMSIDVNNRVRYWDYRALSSFAELIGHSSLVEDAAFAPSGDYGLTVSDDGTMRVWNLMPGNLLRTYPAGLHRGRNTDIVTDLRFDTDSNPFVLRATEEGLEYVNLPSGELISSIPIDGAIHFIRLTPDARTAVAVYDRDFIWHIGVWDIASGEQTHDISTQDRFVDTLTVRQDSAVIAAAFFDDINNLFQIELIDVQTGETILTLEGHRSNINRMLFSSDGLTLFSASDDGTVREWDLDPNSTSYGTQVNFYPQLDYVYSLALTIDQRILAVGIYNGEIHLWDRETSERVIVLTGHRQIVRALAFNREGTQLISGADDETLIVWDVASGRNMRRFTDTNLIQRLFYAPDGNSIYTISLDRVAQWRLDTLPQLLQWTYQNRYIPTMRCEDRALFGVEPLCTDATRVPHTPLIDLDVPDSIDWAAGG
jgi:WD40 repeat protein